MNFNLPDNFNPPQIVPQWIKIEHITNYSSDDGVMGHHVSINATGNIFALSYSSDFNYAGPTNNGDPSYVKVYQSRQLSGDEEFVQLGASIISDQSLYFDLQGDSISLSDNGMIIAIGSKTQSGASDNNDSKRGVVRVFEYKIPSDDEWDDSVMKGEDTNREDIYHTCFVP